LNGPAFVTGGSGFVGGAVIRALRASGRPVVALARSAQGAREIELLGARPARGDVLDPVSLDAAMRGCEVVFHIAGVNETCLRDPTPMVRVNVDGSRNALEAASRAGVRRFVHTSSAATIGEEAGAVGREDTPHRGWFLTAYERSKHEAERLVLGLGRDLPVEVVRVNPASVQGPGRAGGSARLLLDHLNGRLPFAVDARISVVDIDDCARGHVLAAERGTAGERYLLCGAALTVREALALLERITGVRRRTVFVPRWCVRPAGDLAGAVGRVLGRRSPLCRELARSALHGHIFDGSRATSELGLVYTPLDQTLRRTLAWFEERGLLREN
jgi:dihydroflavonol-4-reductase